MSVQIFAFFLISLSQDTVLRYIESSIQIIYMYNCLCYSQGNYGYIYIYDLSIILLAYIYFVNSFFLSLGCFYILLIMSFKEQKIFTFAQVIFFLQIMFLVSHLRNLCLIQGHIDFSLMFTSRSSTVLLFTCSIIIQIYLHVM